jgi:transposase
MKKKEAKKLSRERFINRLLTQKMSIREIEKRLDKQFDFEKN